LSPLAPRSVFIRIMRNLLNARDEWPVSLSLCIFVVREFNWVLVNADYLCTKLQLENKDNTWISYRTSCL